MNLLSRRIKGTQLNDRKLTDHQEVDTELIKPPIQNLLEQLITFPNLPRELRGWAKDLLDAPPEDTGLVMSWHLTSKRLSFTPYQGILLSWVQEQDNSNDTIRLGTINPLDTKELVKLIDWLIT